MTLPVSHLDSLREKSFELGVATVGAPLQPFMIYSPGARMHQCLQPEDNKKEIKTKVECMEDVACDHRKAEEKGEEIDVGIGTG